jgi:ketosteroid isomerase-like protein
VRHTQQVARRHVDAWTSGDRDTAAALLSPDFRFTRR